ncbi:hypothetical protein CPB83DRAFT_879443 [Crepidotus variabilis]|uniref:Uncharacterized protein n=1 Tax=Crepidotus variabilis TaxID=179855 RepID=A0A9P6JW53_9AGAR|nr:hypothetical protein CPB83DRAFT_879443 [Crepidotus variabilis]
MKAIILALTFLVSCAAATNSGIFKDDGTVTVVSRSLAEADLSTRQPVPLPVAVPDKRQNTNAYRLRRGLPPLPPVKKRTGALYPRASCASLSSNKGVIAVTKVSTNTIIGYVRKTFDGQNSYTFGPLSNALTVSLPSGSSVNSNFEITAVNGPDAAHPFFGAVGGSGGYNFSPGQLGYAYLAGTGHTAPNSPPSSTAGTSIQSLGYNGPAESSIWSINCMSHQLTAKWTNADSSQPPTSLFYDPPVDFVGLIGDKNKFDSVFTGEGAYTITFTFVPI